MSTAATRNLWQVVVGFFLGGFVANLFGIALIALAQSLHGQFAYVHLLSLSWKERLFWMAIPTSLAICLLRRRPYVALGMLFSGAMIWLITNPMG
jgi:hypothetical protein